MLGKVLRVDLEKPIDCLVTTERPEVVDGPLVWIDNCINHELNVTLSGAYDPTGLR